MTNNLDPTKTTVTNDGPMSFPSAPCMEVYAAPLTPQIGSPMAVPLVTVRVVHPQNQRRDLIAIALLRTHTFLRRPNGVA